MIVIWRRLYHRTPTRVYLLGNDRGMERRFITVCSSSVFQRGRRVMREMGA